MAEVIYSEPFSGHRASAIIPKDQLAAGLQRSHRTSQVRVTEKLERPSRLAGREIWTLARKVKLNKRADNDVCIYP